MPLGNYCIPSFSFYITVYVKKKKKKRFSSLDCVSKVLFTTYLALDIIFGWEQIPDIYCYNLNHRKSQNMCSICLKEFILHFQFPQSFAI